MKFVFFTPTMERTGSEIILNSIISKTIHSSSNQALVVTRRIGELVRGSALPVLTVENIPETKNLFKRAINWVLRTNKACSRRLLFSRVRELYPESVWIVNTVAQGDVIRYAKKYRIKIILFVHEREHRYKPKDIPIQMDYPELLVACSKTAMAVAKKFGRIKPATIVYPGVDIEWLQNESSSSEDLRKKLGISKTAFIWGMSGTVDVNKNPLRFLELAKELKKSHEVAFLWIGKKNDYHLFQTIEKMQKNMGLEEVMHWVGELDRIQLKNYMQIMDAFVLTSNLESFPVAVIEALALGKMVFSFDCGGVKEILTEDIGTVHPDHNILTAANTMREIMDGKRVYSTKNMYQRASNYSIRATVASWDAAINKFMAEHE